MMLLLVLLGLMANPGKSLAAASSPNTLIVTASSAASNAGQATIQVAIPDGFSEKSITVVLNGKDISARFTSSFCAQEFCLTGTVGVSDGLLLGKNVVYATAHSNAGGLVTGRARFQHGPVQKAKTATIAGAKNLVNSPRARAAASGASTSSFLPPTVALGTIYGGGWLPGSAWLQLGATQYPTSDQVINCNIETAHFLVLVFDHQTLEPISIGSNQCQPSNAALAAYLQTLAPNGQTPANYLVVVGTFYDSPVPTDTPLDTTAIGGTNFNGAQHQPNQYMAIGVPGATPGTAFENYSLAVSNTDPDYTPMWVYAGGVLQEDQNGNYNYESSDVLEYWVDPFTQDPSADHPGSVTIGPSLAQSLANPALKGYRFLPPAISGTHRGGYWLLVLQRDTPQCDDALNNCANNPQPSPNDGLVRIANAGTLYFTGDTDSDTTQAAYQSLANDLNAIGPYDLAFLSTFSVGSGGFPVCCGTPWDVTGNSTWVDDNGNANPNPSNTYAQFRSALELLGGSGRATLFYDFNANQWNTNPEYTYVFSRGSGDPLAGNSAVSASDYASTGQTGYIHGVLARNGNGLFQPYQTSQMQNAAQDAATGSDYLMTKLATLQPVPWPELSGTLLSGASTVAGQEAAYHYVSNRLLENYYIKGVSGNYLDDIHYFFTGSNANYINYHYFDPINLTAPDYTNGQYCWSGPAQDQYPSQVCFTPSDFTAVTKQVSAEVTYLTNVMNFMVSGPVNLKNLVATGNSNAGLALTNAAATILSSGLTPAQTTTKVKVNMSNVLSMFGGIVTLGMDLATDGALAEITPELEEGVDFWGTALGDTLSAVGSGTAGLHTPTTTTTGIPGRFISFTTTIGDLADSGLQDQMGIAFDTKLDSFLGDWQKLSILGPKITDNTQPTYYSPNQVSQDAAVSVLSRASQRSFYMSLLPNFYGVYFFPEFAGVNPFLDFVNEPPVTNQPDMGSKQNTGKNTTGCAPFFMPTNTNQYGNGGVTAPALGFVWTPTAPYGKTINQLPYGNGNLSTFSPADFFVIASNPPSNPHTTQTSAAFMSDNLAQQLFTPSGFNIPLDLFVDQLGPLQSTWFDANTGIRSNDPLGFLPPEMCVARDYTSYRGGGSSLGGAPPPPPTSAATTTTLTAPSSILLGGSAALQAQVSAKGVPMTTGNIIFLQDKQTVESVAVDATGSASFTINGLALGAHTVQALYQPVTEGYAPSESSAATMTVYGDSPNMSISLSQSTLQVSYGTTSAPVSVKVTSLYGMTGPVLFSCLGLPINMTCSFDPATASLTNGASITTNVTITSQTVSSAGIVGSGRLIGLCSLLSLVFLWIARRRFNLRISLAVLVLILAGTISGCSGSKSSPVKETGTKTVFVNATAGTLTQSAILVVNIQ